MPDNDLPKEAQAAWDAYREMSFSKAAYFSLLQELDQKYKEGGEPTIAENLQLEKLLKAHDEKVIAFNEAMKNVVDPYAREKLLDKLKTDTSGMGKH